MTVQGPVKEQQPDGMSHGGLGSEGLNVDGLQPPRDCATGHSVLVRSFGARVHVPLPRSCNGPRALRARAVNLTG